MLPSAGMRRLHAVAVFGSVLCGAAVWLHAQAPAYDLLIRNARVLDGTGSP